jgi:nitrogen fixation protein
MSVEISITDQIVEINETSTPVEISVAAGAIIAPVWGGITGTLSNQTDLQNALNLKVPYTGATTNVNLGEFEMKAGQLTLDLTPTGTAAVSTTRWNDTNGVSETTLKGGSVVLKNGIDLVARVVNKVTPNATLTKAAYQAVRVSGAQGQRLAVAYAQANNDANSADTIGLVTETIATNQEGFIMAVGQLENINTTGSLQGETWVDGDVLYLSPTTAGAITKVKPTAGGHIVVIGYVEYAHVNNGKIYVKIMNGWELTELHDVDIVTPLNNEGLFYESATSLWKNKSIATALGYTPQQALTLTTTGTSGASTLVGGTLNIPQYQSVLTNPITGTGTSGQVAYFTGATTQGGSNFIFFDITNQRLGLGTITPQYQFHVAPQAFFNGGIRLGTGYSAIDVVTGASGLYLSGSQGALNHVLINSSGRLILGGGADSAQRLQVTGTSYFSDSVGIGNSGSVASSLRISKALATGNTIGIYMDSQIQSTLSNVSYFQSEASTSASAITITHLRHYFATAPSFGAGSTVTNQYGFAIQGSTLINATNNYGFWGDIAAGTNRWNLYMGGTANNYMAGSLAVGTTSFNDNANPYKTVVFYNTSGSAGGGFMVSANQAANGANAMVSAVQWALSDGTKMKPSGFFFNYATLGQGNRANSSSGNFIASTQIAGANFIITNNNAYINHTDINSTSNDYVNYQAYLYVQRNSGTVNVNGYQAFRSVYQFAVGSETITNFYDFVAAQPTLAASALVTNRYGLFIDFNNTQVTNAWGLYQTSSTVKNYLNGELLLGSTTSSGEKLQVNGTAKITGATTFGSSVIASGLISSVTEFRLNNQSFTRVAIADTGGGFAGGYNLALSSGVTPIHDSTGAISGVHYRSGGIISFYTGSSQTAGTVASERMRLDSSGSLGIGTTSPNASAILQADSTTKGFLPPRMTNAQRTAIGSPAVGLIVYCTDMVEGLYVYKSTGWTFII